MWARDAFPCVRGSGLGTSSWGLSQGMPGIAVTGNII